MRYIYALRDKKELINTNLKVFQNEIEKVLKDMNLYNQRTNLVITEELFEFSYSGTLLRSKLRKMGKYLANLGVGKKGFVRQYNKAYAFISYDESKAEDEQIMLEFVDCSTIGFKNENKYDDSVPEWIRFYRNIELCTSYTSLKCAMHIFGNVIEKIKEEKVVCVVKLKHHYIENVEGIENNIFDERKTCIIEHLYSEGDYQSEIVDLVDIKDVRKLSYNDEKLIKDLFEFDIQGEYAASNQRKALEKDEKCVYTFRVHDVGQALATSIEEKDKKPFFYFDYGMSYGRNKNCKVNSNLPIEEGATILLSHVDEDHWCGFRKNQKALKCRWIIPQTPTIGLRQLLSSVYFSGGSILLYKAKGIDRFIIKHANNYMLAGNGVSRVSPKRPAMTVHETGIALFIFAEYKGYNYRIIVSGDQDYDYSATLKLPHNTDILSDVNILVACHHGGKYSWSKRTTLPKPNINNNLIVYSFGKCNSYGHPSMCDAYKNVGWNTEHKTADKGDFTIDLKLTDTSYYGAIARMLYQNNTDIFI